MSAQDEKRAVGEGYGAQDSCGEIVSFERVVFVLWHRYSDGSGAHVERVYTDKRRAEQDFALLTRGVGGKSDASEWRLHTVPLVG